MATALDVADYILRKPRGKMTATKLQKLVYYCQAWSLVWDNKSLFQEKICAWFTGPVVPSLYDAHQGKFKVSSVSGGDHRNLKKKQKETIDAVLEYYGDRKSQWLSDLTHMELPWREAYGREKPEITRTSMRTYYSRL